MRDRQDWWAESISKKNLGLWGKREAEQRRKGGRNLGSARKQLVSQKRSRTYKIKKKKIKKSQGKM